jgi:hypothetical protein
VLDDRFITLRALSLERLGTSTCEVHNLRGVISSSWLILDNIHCISAYCVCVCVCVCVCACVCEPACVFVCERACVLCVRACVRLYVILLYF